MRQYSSNDKQWIARAVVLAILDVVFITASYFLSLMLRFDFIYSHISPQHLIGFRKLMIPYCISVVVIFYFFHLYHSIWRFASASELERMVLAWGVFQLVVLVVYCVTKIRMPMSFWLGGALLGFLLTTGMRFSYRFLRGVKGSLEQRQEDVTGNERVMVIGAGESGRSIIHEYIMSRYLNARVCCVIDDNPVKKGRYLDGVPIEGGRQEIRRCVKKYQITTIIFAIPTANGVEKKEILDICGQTGCKVKVIPGIYQLVDGKVSVSQLRDIQIEDLQGGLVTVTDRGIIRYFMTIQEAISLVLQSAHYAKGGEIFALDMVEPVRTDDIARNLIRPSGYTPDVDIKVVYTGLRPGEKLYEELLIGTEGLQETPNKLIYIAEPIEMDDELFAENIRQLCQAAESETEDPRPLIEKATPTFHPSSVGDLKSSEWLDIAQAQ